MHNQLIEQSNANVDVSAESKKSWHRPTIGKIDIRRTMGGSGPNGDSPSGTTVF